MLLATLFVAAGLLHFVRLATYERMVPHWLPAPRSLVLVSGVLQILGGVGVLLPVTRKAAGWGLIAVLVAVFPANVQMLIDARAADASRWWQTLLALRLPVQSILIYWVYRAAVRHRT
jgi:uncharacterized membrane protein